MILEIWKSFSGFVQLQIVSPEPNKLLGEFTRSGIELFDIHDGNDLTVSVKARRKDLKIIRTVAQRKGASIKITGRFGTFWSVKRVILRPAVLLGLALLLITVFYLPSKVCFVTVQGNNNVPTNLILSCAEECGIGFGATRSDVRSERVKNMLLSKIPQIQWVGVNTQGCTAIITVREKSEEDYREQDNRIRSIVAVCDGVVDQCTVTKGNGLCHPGMAVKEGQVLVSAYTDCGIMIQATRADAEIYGTTKRSVEVVTPVQMVKRGTTEKKRKKYSVIIGKKQIKFYKGSGISDAECVKMKEIRYLTLPGGYQLPIAIVAEWVETCDEWETVSTDSGWVEAYAEGYLRSVMISGRILNSTVVNDCSTDIYHLIGAYDCYEMIGIPKYEETME